jgi:hypothetical protein
VESILGKGVTEEEFTLSQSREHQRRLCPSKAFSR